MVIQSFSSLFVASRVKSGFDQILVDSKKKVLHDDYYPSRPKPQDRHHCGVLSLCNIALHLTELGLTDRGGAWKRQLTSSTPRGLRQGMMCQRYEDQWECDRLPGMERKFYRRAGEQETGRQPALARVWLYPASRHP